MLPVKTPGGGGGGAAPATGGGSAEPLTGGTGVEEEVLGEGTADVWGSDRGWRPGLGRDRGAPSSPDTAGAPQPQHPAGPLTGLSLTEAGGGGGGSKPPTPRVRL